MAFSGFFEQETLGDIKNGKNRQQGIVQRVTQIIDNTIQIKVSMNEIAVNNLVQIVFLTLMFIPDAKSSKPYDC